MEYRKLGSSDLNCSVVALGTWSTGGDFWGPVDDNMSIDAIRAGLDAGINVIDTAPIYGRGHSEEVVGRAIEGRKRDEIILCTKVGIPFTQQFSRDSSAKAINIEIEDSLRRLGTDYVDLYQVHWPDPNVPFEETFTALRKLCDAGKARYIGVSNFSIEQIEQAQKYCPIVSVQPPYSLLERNIEQGLLPYCAEKNIGVLTYGSIGAGALTGKFKERPTVKGGDKRASFYQFFSEERWPKTALIAEVLETIAKGRACPTVQVAINWVLKQPGVTVALVGVKNPEQARMNAGAGSWSLSDEENAVILNAYDEIMG